MTIRNIGSLHELTATVLRALTLYSLAEFQSGNSTTIWLTAEGSAFSITDDGRGHSLDKNVSGTSYLKFIYTHFDYPFESDQGAPVQLQGIGMSLANSLCSELTLTVRKSEEELQHWYRNGKLFQSNRAAVFSKTTGITIEGIIRSTSGYDTSAVNSLEEWLQGVLASNPSLKLFFNGTQLLLSKQTAA